MRIKDFFSNRVLLDTIPKNDVVAKQRFILFRIFSYTGFLVCVGVCIKMLLTIPDAGWLPFGILMLGGVMLANFFLAPVVKSFHKSYVAVVTSAFILLHIVSYSCGGIQTAGTMYFAVVILYAFMLLGRKGGLFFSVLAGIHVVYLFIISTHTSFTSFAMFKNEGSLINEDFLTNALLVFFLVASQANYLQSNKNVVIQKLEQDKAALALKNKMLITKNELLNKNAIVLERTNNDLEKFAYVASHDLKAPLRAIGSLAGMIEEDAGHTFEPDVRKNFDTIKGRVQRMEFLINALLQYSKYTNKEFNSEPVDVRAVVDQVLSEYSEKPNIHLEINLETEIIDSDVQKLQPVFRHLLDNAIRFNDKEWIEIKIGLKSMHDEWVFTLQDNGPGIEKQYHEKVFVIFQTLQARDRNETIGAGLAITKKIIENAGGTIKLESEKGLGCRFIFTIPKRKQETAKQSLMVA